MSTVRLAVAGLMIASLLVASPAAAAGPPTFDGDARELSHEGNLQLKWTGADDLEFELQRGSSAAFSEPTTIYRGGAKARFVSGLRNGTYHFRVRAREGGGDWSAWSGSKTLEVQHWSEARAVALMGLGALVFILTAAMIVVGARREDAGVDPA